MVGALQVVGHQEHQHQNDARESKHEEQEQARHFRIVPSVCGRGLDEKLPARAPACHHSILAGMPTSFQAELVACFGQPVAENPTGVMQEAAFRALGLSWRYLTIEVPSASLADAITGVRAMAF